jgi:predicted DNA-binding transcriptional regulator AlpA
MDNTPRMIDLASVARRMGRSRSWIYRKMDDLNRLGFPAPHPVIGRWDSELIEGWLHDKLARISAIVDGKDWRAANRPPLTYRGQVAGAHYYYGAFDWSQQTVDYASPLISLAHPSGNAFLRRRDRCAGFRQRTMG